MRRLYRLTGKTTTTKPLKQQVCFHWRLMEWGILCGKLETRHPVIAGFILGFLWLVLGWKRRQITENLTVTDRGLTFSG